MRRFLNFRIHGPCRADHVMNMKNPLCMHATSDPCLRFQGTERSAGPWSGTRMARTSRILSFSAWSFLFGSYFSLQWIDYRPKILRNYIFVEGCRRALLAALPLRAMLAGNTIAILQGNTVVGLHLYYLCCLYFLIGHSIDILHYNNM